MRDGYRVKLTDNPAAKGRFFDTKNAALSYAESLWMLGDSVQVVTECPSIPGESGEIIAEYEN